MSNAYFAFSTTAGTFPSGLDQEVEHLAFVVDRPPQPVLPASDLDGHFIKMPACTRPGTAAAKITGDQPPKFQEPAPDGLVRNIDAPLSQQFFDIAKRKREPGIKPNRVLDDRGRKAMSLEGYRGHAATVAIPDRPAHPLNVSMPAGDCPAAARLLGRLRPGTIMLAAKAYDPDWLRRRIEQAQAVPTLPLQSNRNWKER